MYGNETSITLEIGKFLPLLELVLEREKKFNCPRNKLDLIDSSIKWFRLTQCLIYFCATLH